MMTRFFSIYFLLATLICCGNLLAQKPQKILGIAKENYPISYYEEQSQLWCELTEEDPTNAEAWWNYYMAQRAVLQLKEPDAWLNDKATFFGKLDLIIQKSKVHIGETFEYHFLRGNNAEGEASLQAFQEAYDTDPDRPEVYGWLFTYNVPRFNEEQCRDLGQRMLKHNIYSNANLKWNYNALQSVAPNGIIIANGDMDALPKWVLQYGANVRPDVLVVSKWFMATDEDYRKAVLARINLSADQLKTADDFSDHTAYADYLTVQLLTNDQKTAYISAGTPRQFFRDHQLEDNMYLVGNALQYATKAFDNTAVMQNNVAEKYHLEHLQLNFQQHPEDQMVHTQMHLTYLPCFVHLRNYYEELGQIEQSAYYTELITQIADASGRKEEVLDWFKD